MRAALLFVTVAGCAMPIGLPPLRTDLGIGTDRGTPTGHVAAGASLVSGQVRENAAVDLGLGYTLDLAFADTPHVLGQGMYVDAAWLQSSPTRRTSLGVRGALLIDGDGETGADGKRHLGGGVMLRVSREAYQHGRGPWSTTSRCGFGGGYYHGSSAIGVYAESGAQVLPAGRTAWLTTAGLTFRLPAWAGIGVGIPGCK